MNMYEKRDLKTVDDILAFDKEVREKTREIILN